MNHMQRGDGIILKSYIPYKNKLAILDSVLGRIDGIPDTQRLCVGGLIHYHALPHANHYLIRTIEHIAVPVIIDQSDILFIHHVLEVCYLSIAVASCELAVFTLLCTLYQEHDASTLYKKALVAKLFFLLHLPSLPHQSPVNHILATMITESVDMLVHQLIHLSMEKELDKWLHRCIEEHPYRDRFKTIDFYARMASL